MFDNVKSNKKIIEIKEDKNKKDSVNNIGAIAKPTINLTESKRDPRIPDWLPEKDNVAVVEPIDKPPHLRSKVSLIYHSIFCVYKGTIHIFFIIN